MQMTKENNIKPGGIKFELTVKLEIIGMKKERRISIQFILIIFVRNLCYKNQLLIYRSIRQACELVVISLESEEKEDLYLKNIRGYRTVVYLAQNCSN